MRYLRTFAAASLVLFAVGCADKGTQTLTGPKGDTPSPVLTTPSCNLLTEDQLIQEIRDLYFKNQWPDPNSALSKFRQVTSALAANNLDGARAATQSLVDFITNKYEHLVSPTPDQEIAFNQLITDLWCFVGVSDEVFDLNPEDDAKVFAIPGVGGVWFPARVVPVGTNVTLTDLTSDQNFPGLNTPLDQYSSYIDIQLTPTHTFTYPNLPIVLVCPAADVPLDLQLLLGHDDPVTGFELLQAPDFIPPELAAVCESPLPSARTNQSSGWLARWVDRAAALLLPRTLEAAPAFFIGGIGGSPLRFSPFGAVDYSLSATGGIGGSPLRFAPPVQPGAVASPANTPPELPENYVQGPVGTNASAADLAKLTVTIKTVGDDGLANPIAGVWVTFKIGASGTYDPDSEAAVCDAQDVDQPLGVSVPTDADGVATLPCLKFGNTPGFANLEATFEPDSIGFTGDQLLQITATDGQTISSSINWLIKSNVGAAATLSIVTPPSATPTAGEAFSTQPTVKVTDALGNPVSGATVTVALTTVGDGTLGCFSGTGCTTAVTGDDGTTTFANLMITGQVAGIPQTLTFSSSGATDQTANVTPTAGDAKLLTVVTAPVAGQLGTALSTQPVAKVTDQWGNPISGATVGVAITAGGGSLGCVSPATGCTSTTTTGTGEASFDNLKISGLVAGVAQTLTFSSPGTTDQTATVTPTAGAPYSLDLTTLPGAEPGGAQLGQPLNQQPVAKVTDQWGNPISGASVDVEITAGGGSLGCVSPANGCTSTVTTGTGEATFDDLKISGLVAGVAQTLTFTSGTLTKNATVTPTAGPATVIIANSPAGGTYPGSFAPFTSALNPQVKVTDADGNLVSANVYWQLLANPPSGGSLSATSTTSSATTGLSSVVWTLGDGANQLKASLNADYSAPAVVFSATTSTGNNLAACTSSGSIKKTDLARYNSTLLGYMGYLSIKTATTAKGFMRKVQVNMSVTGQSSGSGDYPTTVRAYRNNNGAKGDLVATGQPNTADFTLKLPGSNSKPSPVIFNMVPNVIAGVAQAVGLGEVVIIEIQITAASTRTFQVWYNTRPNGACLDSKLYPPALEPPSDFNTSSVLTGLHLTITN